MRGQAALKSKGVLVLVWLGAGAVLAACGPAAPAGFGLIPPAALETTATVLPSPSATITPTFTATATHTLEPSPVPPSASPTATATATHTVAPTATASPTVVPSPTLGPTPDAEAHLRVVTAPILMYHYVEPWPPGPDELRQGLTVRPEDFAAQMAYLHAQGYASVSLYDLVEALAVGKPLPEKPVIITFDDGYRSLMDFALPELQRYGYTATVFVITQLMDEGFPQYLTWEQAQSLYALGWKVEPHTKTHDQLGGRGRDFQLYQMLGSLQTVEARMGVTPRFIAYPSGAYDDLSVELAKELHLWGAATVNYARVHTYSSLHEMGRVRVSGLGTLEEFVAALGDGP
jgi:peptidoglycan/xylan/chitin deacetylase (PgdA/CDA1 family)